MKLFRWALEKRAKKMIERGARLRIIGDLSKFPEDIRGGIEKMVEESKKNTKINVTYALNYGGRDEMVRAIRKGVVKEILRLSDLSHQIKHAKDDKADLESLSALSNSNLIKMVEHNLDTAGIPDPELIIRTGGTKRLSGFMLWQCEYSELYFTETLMPDFGKEAFEEAIEEYGARERRFGG